MSLLKLVIWNLGDFRHFGLISLEDVERFYDEFWLMKSRLLGVLCSARRVLMSLAWVLVASVVWPIQTLEEPHTTIHPSS